MKAAYVKTELKSVISISEIVTIHYYEFDKSFVFAGESHDFWEMVYVDRGRVRVKRDEEELILSQGEIIFHKPNEFHSIRAEESSPNFFVVSFDTASAAMKHFEGYHTVLNKTLAPFISSVIREAEATYDIPKNDPDLTHLSRKQNAPVGGEQLIKTYLEQLFVLLLRGMTREAGTSIFPSKERLEGHLVVSMKKMIEERVTDAFRVGDLCAALGYSESYLCRLFREQTGETVAAYAVRVRIGRAKEMIREGRLNFTQIAARLGFQSAHYFSRRFKLITGMSPSEYAESVKMLSDAALVLEDDSANNM